MKLIRNIVVLTTILSVNLFSLTSHDYSTLAFVNSTGAINDIIELEEQYILPEDFDYFSDYIHFQDRDLYLVKGFLYDKDSSNYRVEVLKFYQKNLDTFSLIFSKNNFAESKRNHFAIKLFKFDRNKLYLSFYGKLLEFEESNGDYFEVKSFNVGKSGNDIENGIMTGSTSNTYLQSDYIEEIVSSNFIFDVNDEQFLPKHNSEGNEFLRFQPKKIIDIKNRILAIGDVSNYKIILDDLNSGFQDTITRNAPNWSTSNKSLNEFPFSKRKNHLSFIHEINFIDSSKIVVKWSNPSHEDFP
ncbi:hypothetical protein OAQ99_06075 [Candidatus Kapabacteria bacterium]|nr:hypothetical protein [Candidatus Kapabacteria bacterium]